MPNKNAQLFIDAIISLHKQTEGGIQSEDIQKFFAASDVTITGSELSELFRLFKSKFLIDGDEYMSNEERQRHGAFRINKFDSKLLDLGS